MVVVVVRELFSLVMSAICVRIRGYEDCLPHGSSFHVLLHSYHNRFVGTIYTILLCKH